jgi:hypothetical protein
VCRGKSPRDVSGATHTLRALVDLSEEIIRNEDADPAMYGGDNARNLDFLLRRWLAAVEPSRRFNALASIAEHSPGLPLIAQFVRSLGPDRSSQGAHEKSSLLTEQEFATIRDIVLERVRKLASDGLLWSVSDPAAVLWSWWARGKTTRLKCGSRIKSTMWTMLFT